MDRQGAYQHWDQVWDSRFSYGLRFRSLALVEEVLRSFIGGIGLLGFYVSARAGRPGLGPSGFYHAQVPGFSSLLPSLLSSLAQDLLILGRCWFLRYQGWVVVSILAYRPKLPKVGLSIPETPLDLTRKAHHFLELELGLPQPGLL
jgi:hypothetical protein